MTGTDTLAAHAAERGLHHRAPSMALPKATRLMRHDFMQEVPSLARGDLPSGLAGSWLAQDVYEGRMDLERSLFTLVLVRHPSCGDRFRADADERLPLRPPGHVPARAADACGATLNRRR